MVQKIYNMAPLPFQGQKRFFVREFAEILREYTRKHQVRCVVDLFGGSGLLAHTAKKVIPDARVIYNDFDDFHIRVLNVNKTNRLLADIRDIVGDYSRGARITPELRQKVLERVRNEEKKGYVDYITLGSSILFSGKRANNFDELERETFYNTVKREPYDPEAGEYLAGLEIYKTDYVQLFDKFKDEPGVVFVVDPPYLSTDTRTYNSDRYWKLKDYLNVLRVLKDSNYVYFTSDKSSIVELCDWLEDNMDFNSPFTGAAKKSRRNVINHNSGYEDMMLYKLAG